MTYTVRPMGQQDVPALTDLLNHTIRRGGTTAYEDEFNADTFADEFLTAPSLISSLVALSDEAAPVGFQVIYGADEGGERAVHIGSFTDQRTRYPGAGRALFGQTLTAARAFGAAHIVATIRADNVPGLSYYRALGFRDHSVQTRVPLKDGTPVDRIETRYPLT